MSKKPRFGSAMLFDSTVNQPGGKIDGNGVINSFLAYAFPCDRQCQLVCTLYDVPEAKQSVLISVKKRRTSEVLTIGICDIEKTHKDGIHTIVIPINVGFRFPGAYEFILTFKDHPGKLVVPFTVIQKKMGRLNRVL